MLNPKYFIMVYKFTRDSTHERTFFNGLRESCVDSLVIKESVLAVRSNFRMSEIYRCCAPELDENEYLLIFPLTHQYLPHDPKLQHYLDFGDSM